MSWGVIEILEPEVQYHVVPMVDLDGELVASAAHDLYARCPCGPVMEYNAHGYPMYQHHDRDAPGAMSDEEWTALKEKSNAKQVRQ